jgi:Tol biopolymer transport system component
MTMSLLLGLALTASAAEVSVSQAGHASNPSWSPDGGWLAFEVNNYGGNIDLFLVEVSNGNPMGTPQKINIPGSSSSFSSGGSVVAAPSWHPRGIVIFEGSNAGNDNRLYQQTPEGAAAGQLLTSGQIGGDLSWPAVSADGKHVAFVSDISGSGDIYYWDRASNQVVQAVESPYSEMAPRYNADGTRLVYSRKNRGSQDLFTWDGTQSTPLVGGNGDQTRPVWAGDSVVFFSNERGDDHWDIAISSGVGEKKTIARDVRLPQRATPAISPDGRWVAYGVEDPANSGKIMFTRVDGSSTVSLATGVVACGEPALIEAGGRIFLAYTALPSKGADWRQLHIEDVTSLLR